MRPRPDCGQPAAWHLRDNELGRQYRTPRDQRESRDFGYLARLPRPDGLGTVMVAAGIHPIGLQGVIAVLEDRLAELYSTLGTKQFSVVVECTFDRATLSVTTAELVGPPYLHPVP